jgi:hypothetical protein
MKRILATAVVVAALVGLAGIASVSAKPPPTMLDMADLSNADVTAGGECSSFSAEQPGAWGGEFGGGAVTAFPGDEDDAGYCTLNSGGAKARHIQMRVLDGIADDSFNVFVKSPGSDWTLVYSYAAAPSTAEVWVEHDIYSFPAGKGQGSTVDIKIEPTNVGWSGFTTWGQLAVDYVKLFDH